MHGIVPRPFKVGRKQKKCERNYKSRKKQVLEQTGKTKISIYIRFIKPSKVERMQHKLGCTQKLVMHIYNEN